MPRGFAVDRCKAHTHLGFLLDLPAWGHGNLVPVAPGRELRNLLLSQSPPLRPQGQPPPLALGLRPRPREPHPQQSPDILPYPPQWTHRHTISFCTCPHTYSFSFPAPLRCPLVVLLSHTHPSRHVQPPAHTHTASMADTRTFSHTDPHTNRLSFTYTLGFPHRPPHTHIHALLHILPHLLSHRLVHKYNTHSPMYILTTFSHVRARTHTPRASLNTITF